jgi:hypothetical protein
VNKKLNFFIKFNPYGNSQCVVKYDEFWGWLLDIIHNIFSKISKNQQGPENLQQIILN